jgi:hypothetical protein
MRISLGSSVFLWAAIASALSAAPVLAEGPTADGSARPECAYDREATLALEFVAFDQTEGKGWRPLNDAQCYVEAAELLRGWQARRSGDFDLAKPDDRFKAEILRWHEAQMWAFGNRTDLALPLFATTRRKGESFSDVAWNYYVDGTLAFLQRNRPGLEDAIAGLAVVPKPPGWDNARGADGQPISMRWPQNLDVLDGLLRCWEQPYAVAYVCRDIQKLR